MVFCIKSRASRIKRLKKKWRQAHLPSPPKNYPPDSTQIYQYAKREPDAANAPLRRPLVSSYIDYGTRTPQDNMRDIRPIVGCIMRSGKEIGGRMIRPALPEEAAASVYLLKWS